MKKYDIVAKVGTYTSNGETKGRFVTVGVVMEHDGKPYILLNRTFNPAGVPNPDNKDNVLLSLYEPRYETNQHTVNKGNGFAPDSSSGDILMDEIPFN